MKKCAVCGDQFTSEEISEWWADREEFSTSPFMCPDCYDRFQRKSLEDQLKDLMTMEGRGCA